MKNIDLLSESILAHIRLALPDDASLLRRVELSAAQVFRRIDGLIWLATPPR